MKTEQTKAKALHECDIIFWVAFMLFIMTRVLTVGTLSYIAQDTQTEIKEVAIAYEANPIARSFILIEQSKYVVFYVALPALVIATYWFFRRRVKFNKMQTDDLVYYLNIFLAVMVLNVLNDASVFIGKIL